MRTVGELGHLARRCWWTLRAAPPSAAEEAWACDRMSAEEAELWSRQHPLDRRHTVAVARQLVAEHPEAPGWVVEAALLHDVGKTEAPLGVPGRVLATVLELAGVRSAPGRLGRYLAYPARGAELLAAAGAAAEVAAWAREHHEPPSAWSVPVEWGTALAAADRGATLPGA